uniref:Uncharacterized protein n=1 Tax=Globodera pallida TaxID=36090 RepID=A0A183BYA8_GLOPA
MRSQYIVVKNEVAAAINQNQFCQEQQRPFVAGGDGGGSSNEREGRARFMRSVKTEWIAAGEALPPIDGEEDDAQQQLANDNIAQSAEAVRNDYINRNF